MKKDSRNERILILAVVLAILSVILDKLLKYL